MNSNVTFTEAFSVNGHFNVCIIFSELASMDKDLLTPHEKAILSLVEDKNRKPSERLRPLTQLVQSLEDRGEIKL